MQNNICQSFRGRCLHRGYLKVSIKVVDKKKGIYCVSALEPLCEMYVSRIMSLEEMYHFFR